MDDFSKRVEALSPDKRELLEIFLKEKKIETDWLQDSYVAPRNEVEAALADLWAEVLGVERVGVHDNFFELGGDSILSIQIIAKATEIGLKLNRNQLFEQPTIAELAPLVGVPSPREAEEDEAGPVPLIPAQLPLLQAPAGRAGRVALLEAEPSDPETLRRAVRTLVEHHDALRLSFERREEGWTQTAGEAADPEIAREDLSHLAGAAQEAAAGSAALRLLDGWDLSRPPLLRLARLDCGAGRPARLAVAAHPLVCDAESFRILLLDLGTALRGMPLPPRSTSFRSWCRSLAGHAASPELARELSWWLAQGDAPAAGLPLEGSGARQEPGRPVQVLLDEEATRAVLQEIPAVHRIQVTDLIITALARTLAQWTGVPSVRLDLEGSARTDAVLGADLSRTVGACGFVYPVQLSLAGADTPGAALRAVKEQLRSVPGHGIGYSLLAGGAGPAGAREKVLALPPAPVLVAYQPRLDREGEVRLAGGAAVEPATDGRAHRLTVVAGVARGQVQISWESGEALDHATTERLAASFEAALRELIAECRSGSLTLTPSDFPDADLDQGDLAKLFGR